MNMKDKLTVFTKFLLDVMFYSGIIVTVTLPASIRIYGKYNSYFHDNYYSLCVILFLSGIFAILIIRELRRMFATVIAGDCFLRENVTSLERMYLQFLHRGDHGLPSVYLPDALRAYHHTGIRHCGAVQQSACRRIRQSGRIQTGK